MDVSPGIFALNSGKLGKTIAGRSDVDKYVRGCREMERFVPLIQGGARKMSGTRYVDPAKFSASEGRLIPFEFSIEQAYTLGFGDIHFRVYRDNARVPAVEVVTPYLAADLDGIAIVQSADVLYLAHRSYPPRKIERASDVSWSTTAITWKFPPRLPKNLTAANTLTAAATTGAGVNVTAAVAQFAVTDIGRQLIFLDPSTEDGSNDGWATITGFTSTTIVVVTIGLDLPGTSPNMNWAWGAFDHVSGYPTAVAFSEDRLCWGGTLLRPQSFWCSVTGDYENHLQNDEATGAIMATLNVDDMNAIEFMTELDVLTLGTRGGIFTVTASRQDAAFSANDLYVKRRLRVGCRENLPALPVDDSLLFIQRHGRKLHEFTFAFETDRYVAPDMNTLNDEALATGVRWMCWQREPYRIVYFGRNDGTVVGFAYNRSENVAAWFDVPIGGTDVFVESGCVIPHPDGDQDQLWLLVRRTVNGGTVRYLEVLEKPWDRTNDIEDAFFVDCGLTYDGAEIDAGDFVTGLTHLIGETVAVLTDGATHPDCVVDGSGRITLENAASVVHAGLPYSARLKTMGLDAGTRDGTAKGRSKRVDRIVLALDQTGAGLKYGSSWDDLQVVGFRDVGSDMDTAPELFDGETDYLDTPNGWDRDGDITLQHDEPLPCTVIGIYPHLTTED